MATESAEAMINVMGNRRRRHAVGALVDQTSIHLSRHLAMLTRNRPLLILATARDELALDGVRIALDDGVPMPAGPGPAARYRRRRAATSWRPSACYA